MAGLAAARYPSKLLPDLAGEVDAATSQVAGEFPGLGASFFDHAADLADTRGYYVAGYGHVMPPEGQLSEELRVIAREHIKSVSPNN